jgi:superkiller protein 3
MKRMRFRRPTDITVAVARVFRRGGCLYSRRPDSRQPDAPQRTPGRKTQATAIAARWVGLGLACAWLFAAGNAPVAAGTQTSARRKPPAKSSSSSTHEKDDPLAPLLQQANDAIDKMDFAAALDPLQKYVAQRSDEAYPHFQLGYAYAGLKRPDDAKREFSRAITLDPKMAAAYQNLGLVLMDSDPGSAADAFRHAADLRPTDSRARFLAGYSLERAGKLTEAIEQYRAALALTPKDYEAQFALGRALLRSDNAVGAEEHFRAALDARPDSAPAKLGLASAISAQKKYGPASDEFAEYLKSKPDDASAHFQRADALLNLDRLDEALAELDRFESSGKPSADALKMRGDIYMRQKKWTDAAAALKQAIAASPQDDELAGWMGHADIELRDYPAAIQILEQAHARSPQSVDALSDLANAFYLNENYAQALAAFDLLSKLETPKPGSWFVRAICYDKLSRRQEAIEAYQKFLDQDGGQHDTQDFQARQRIIVLQKELGLSKKK